MLVRVVQQETADQAGALREAHDAVVGPARAQDVEEPFVGFPDGGDGGAVPEGVVGRRVEGRDAGGGVGREGRVDEVEGVGRRQAGADGRGLGFEDRGAGAFAVEAEEAHGGRGRGVGEKS